MALGANLHEISGSVEEAQGVIQSYQDQVTELENDLKSFQAQFPTWLTAAKWGLSLFFLWLGIAQVGLFLQGTALLGTGPSAVVVAETRDDAV